MARIVRVHALRPALMPVLSYLGAGARRDADRFRSSSSRSSAFPVSGNTSFTAALNRDYTLVLGIVIFYAALIILLNLVADLLYGPRARPAREAAMTLSARLLLLVLLLAIVAPWLSPYDYYATDFGRILRAPFAGDAHWFGTDDLGRDLFVRTWLGVRVTLLVAVVASLVSLLIGVTWGAIAGYVGGRVDALMMRIVDTLYALPFIFLVILLMVAFERNFLLIFVAIGAINWLDMARIVRAARR